MGRHGEILGEKWKCSHPGLEKGRESSRNPAAEGVLERCPWGEGNSQPQGVRDLTPLQGSVGVAIWPNPSKRQRMAGCEWCGSASGQRAGAGRRKEMGKQKELEHRADLFLHVANTCLSS